MLTAPCAWPVAHCPEPCDVLEGLGAETLALLEDMATSFLWQWTGRRFGLCETTLRPCRQDCLDKQMSTYRGASGLKGFPWQPALIGGQWFNIVCGVCGNKCSCKRVCELALPGPVAEIVNVTIDGAEVPADSYRVDNYKYLVRQDGGCWPKCQDLSQPLGSEGTWSVSYLYGQPVPSGAALVAGILLCELAKAMCNDNTCRLPNRIQTLTRQGVTVALLDNFEDLDKGRTGIWAIDSWVSTQNNAPQRAVVRSPDVPIPRVTTWVALPENDNGE